MSIVDSGALVTGAAAAVAKDFQVRVDSVELLAGALARHYTESTGEGDDEEAADAALEAIFETITGEAYAAIRDRFEEAVQELRTDYLKREFARVGFLLRSRRA